MLGRKISPEVWAVCVKHGGSNYKEDENGPTFNYSLKSIFSTHRSYCRIAHCLGILGISIYMHTLDSQEEMIGFEKAYEECKLFMLEIILAGYKVPLKRGDY